MMKQKTFTYKFWLIFAALSTALFCEIPKAQTVYPQELTAVAESAYATTQPNWAQNCLVAVTKQATDNIIRAPGVNFSGFVGNTTYYFWVVGNQFCKHHNFAYKAPRALVITQQPARHAVLLKHLKTQKTDGDLWVNLDVLWSTEEPACTTQNCLTVRHNASCQLIMQAMVRGLNRNHSIDLASEKDSENRLTPNFWIKRFAPVAEYATQYYYPKALDGTISIRAGLTRTTAKTAVAGLVRRLEAGTGGNTPTNPTNIWMDSKITATP